MSEHIKIAVAEAAEKAVGSDPQYPMGALYHLDLEDALDNLNRVLGGGE